MGDLGVWEQREGFGSLCWDLGQNLGLWEEMRGKARPDFSVV